MWGNSVSQKRSKRNQGLPPYLYEQDGRYYYKNRKHGLSAALGTDKQRAILVTEKTNARLLKYLATQEQEDALFKTELSFAAALEKYKQYRQEFDLADGTKYNEGFLYKKYKELWGGRAIRDIELREVAEQLNTLTKSAHPKHRDFLAGVWQVACSNGMCKKNIVEDTLKKPVAKRERDRLTKELYDEIYSIAPAWMQIAMELALVTLQAREELRNMRYDDIKDGRLHVIRQKTEKKTDKAFIALELTPQLSAIVAKSRDTLLSPYIVHKRNKQKDCKRWPRKHRTQLTPDQLTNEFRRLKRLTGSTSTATFHEIRSLGGHLYRKQGISEEMIQALYGHSSFKTSKHYLKGHEIEWSLASPTLEINRA